MEAYDQHLNKLKMPDIPHVEPHPDSHHTDIPAALLREGSPSTSLMEDRSRITHSTGEFMEERVQTIKVAPDLTKVEAVISSESSPSSEDEHEIDHLTGEKKKKSKVKKVTNKLASGFRKIFGKKEHHEETHEEHREHGDERRGSHEQQQQHRTHVTVEYEHADGKHRHHHALDSDTGDTVPGYVKLEKETIVTSSSPLAAASAAGVSRATLSDKNIQEKLGTAFAEEGQKAARDVTATDASRNRFETSAVGAEHSQMDIGRMVDIQDHSKKAVNFAEENTNAGIFGSEKYLNPSAAPLNTSEIPVLHNKGLEEFKQLRRQSLDQPSLHRRPSQELPSHFESLNVRPEAAHLTRSSEQWNLREEPKLILEDVQRHGKEFSEKFERIGAHRNSLTGNESLPTPAPILERPVISIVEKILDPGYERRLSVAREKWSIPVEERARQLVEETAAVLGSPPSGQVDHFIREKRGSPGGTLIREDKSEATLSDLERDAPTTQLPFERVTSETALGAHSASNTEALPSDIHSPPSIDLSYQRVSITPFASAIPAHGHLPRTQQVHQSSVEPATGQSRPIDHLASGNELAELPANVPRVGSDTGSDKASGIQDEFEVEELKRFRAATADFGLNNARPVEGMHVPHHAQLRGSIDKVPDPHDIKQESVQSTTLKNDDSIQTESVTTAEVTIEESSPHKGVLNTVVESVAGVVGSVVHMFQAKAAEANAAEDEYLPFEVKEKATDISGTSDATLEASPGEPKGLVDTMISSVLHMFTGKEHTAEPVQVEETTIKIEEKPKDPIAVLPISGEFIAGTFTEIRNLSDSAVTRGVSSAKIEEVTIKSASNVAHPVVN